MNENKAYFHNKHLVTFKNLHFLIIQVEQQLHLLSLNDFSMYLPLFKSQSIALIVERHLVVSHLQLF
jgi:hypothetical protein